VWLLTQDGGKTAQLQGDHEGWSGLYHVIRWNVGKSTTSLLGLRAFQELDDRGGENLLTVHEGARVSDTRQLLHYLRELPALREEMDTGVTEGSKHIGDDVLNVLGSSYACRGGVVWPDVHYRIASW
jgi:hypothetical protein